MFGKKKDKEEEAKPKGFFSRLRARLNKGDSWLTMDITELASGGETAHCPFGRSRNPLGHPALDVMRIEHAGTGLEFECERGRPEVLRHDDVEATELACRGDGGLAAIACENVGVSTQQVAELADTVGPRQCPEPPGVRHDDDLDPDVAKRLDIASRVVVAGEHEQ